MAASLGLGVIRASDIARVAKFYEALGCAFVSERHGKGPEHLASDLGGTIFEIYPVGNQPATAGVRLGFIVPSMSAAINAAESAGGTIQTPPAESPWGLRAVLRDPEGHVVEVTQSA